MKFIYAKWDAALFTSLKQLSDLMEIYNYLLMRLGGNVEETLALMKQLQQQGILNKDFDLEEFRQKLEESRLVKKSSLGLKLSSKGERSLRQDAFEQVFLKMRSSGKGDHRLQREGGGSEEPLCEKRAFQFGDSLHNIDFNATLLNSVKRTGSLDLEIDERDLEIYETERTTSCATVLMIDISHSMILYGEDRITPAKQVAMAFTELILSKYPKDSLSVVTFGDTAEEIKISELAYLSVGPFHTNTQAGLRKARAILNTKKHPNKQIFMVTDGKPSMITRANGELYRNPVGLDPRIVNRTLDEAVICRRKKISITTFMVTDDPYLQRFVSRLTELNRGRAYFSSVDNLGKYVFWDFVSNRKKKGR